MLYPLTFRPIFKERIWGGRTLESLYGKVLPSNLPIGESWEISDRAGDVSVVDAGPFAGKDLHGLMQEQAASLLGPVRPLHGRFPLLVKILDARETLSLQVHPPPSAAGRLRGEPKTEMWYVTHAEPGAELYVGLRRGFTRAEFEERLRTGTVADCFHRVPVREGDAMFVPSGRVHGIGAGCVLFEVQQNSDTTYRVFDWNRVDRDGHARDLHISQALQSIDFNDIEPGPVQAAFTGPAGSQVKSLVRCDFFAVDVRRLAAGKSVELHCPSALILGIAAGRVMIVNGGARVELDAGRFCLVPAAVGMVTVAATSDAEFLVVQPL